MLIYVKLLLHARIFFVVLLTGMMTCLLIHLPAQLLNGLILWHYVQMPGDQVHGC